ncbi:ribonuclease Z [Candidatus Magnetomonas plexicatena]|uniref:ribonuclease Z n=1 Tax=Candidatus Magnetomonas plexicatena TaxID=2552947 RepID=UPI001101AD8E|nr:ribonuclease Z [Nitrospirales bacterium LBB_01]
MKTTFFCKQINNPFEDPAVYVRLRCLRHTFLFDCGDISALEPAEILKIATIFVTHMHIDHFIGFDLILRLVLGRDMPLTIYGPLGIIHAVENKLKGFTWNLIKDYPIKIEVFEITENSMSHAGFYAESGFEKIVKPELPFNRTIYNEDGITVNAEIFDHGIPVAGYSLSEESHININKDELLRRGFETGPWLTGFKKAIRNNSNDFTVTLNGKTYTKDDLSSLVMITEGQRVSYITDIAPTDENISKAIELSRDSDILYIEAFFLKEDHERALKRKHLTTAHTGHIAKAAGAKHIELIHISPKYTALYTKAESEVLEALEAS